MRRLGPVERKLQAACEWANEGSPWIPGLPTYLEQDLVYVVRTTTGRILSGKGRAFSGKNLRRIVAERKYGEVVAWMPIGE